MTREVTFRFENPATVMPDDPFEIAVELLACEGQHARLRYVLRLQNRTIMATDPIDLIVGQSLTLPFGKLQINGGAR